MKYFYLATETTCTGDISTCCSDYGIATYLYILKQVLNLIHIVVPIILILMASINLAQLAFSPDDPQRKKLKSLTNKFIAAVFVFFVPFIVNLLFGFIEGFGLEISGCWKAAEETYNIIQKTDEYDADTGESKNNSSSTSNSSSSKKNKNNSNSSTVSGKNIVKYARQFLGNPYVYGGKSLLYGTDCSGFTMSVYEHFGITIPRTAAAQEADSRGKTISSIEEAQPGDLLFYKDNSGNISHVTMYEGDGKVIHASSSTTGIIESDVNYRTYYKIKRFI